MSSSGREEVEGLFVDVEAGSEEGRKDVVRDGKRGKRVVLVVTEERRILLFVGNSRRANTSFRKLFEERKVSGDSSNTREKKNVNLRSSDE
jgi:hypothetical protein